MTREELRKIFGDRLEEGKPIEIKPERINADGFVNYAVFVTGGFSEMYVAKAEIGKPETVKTHGVIPSKHPSKSFNCCIGDYTEERRTVTLDLNRFGKNVERVARLFDANPVFVDRPWIYRRTIAAENVNTLTPYHFGGEPVGYFGFFETTDGVVSAVKDAANSYKMELYSEINRIIQEKDISEAVSAV